MGMFDRLVGWFGGDKELTPLQKLDLAYQKLLDAKVTSLTSLRDLLQAKKNLEDSKNRLEEKINEQDNNAKISFDCGKEELAKGHIKNKLELKRQFDIMENVLKEMEKEDERAAINCSELGTQIEILKARKAIITSKYNSLEATNKLLESTTGLSDDGINIYNIIKEVEDKAGEMEARSGAINELIQRGVLESVLDTSTVSENDIKLELDKLRGGDTNGE
jgi:phage shock protein A